MLTDVQVKEIAYLREYASILSDFKYYILGGCASLGKKAESILEDVGSISRDVERKSNNSLKEADRSIREFQTIVERFNLSSTSKDELGDSYNIIQEKKRQTAECAEKIQNTITEIKSLIEVLSARTLAYSALIGKIAEQGSDDIKKRCDILEQYKRAK